LRSSKLVPKIKEFFQAREKEVVRNIMLYNKFRHVRYVVVLFSLLVLLIITSVSSASVTPQLSSGWYHTIALKSDGTVWTWGENESGQLGNGTTTSSNIPVQVYEISNITAIESGYLYNIVLKSDGTMWGWGSNTAGQLGTATFTSSNTPIEINGLSDGVGEKQ